MTIAPSRQTMMARRLTKLHANQIRQLCFRFVLAGRNAAINLEYLKNCVVGCLRTSEPSEHARLLPVITTILKLSKDEADVIAKNISTRAHSQGSFGGALTPPGKEGGWWSGRMSKR